MLCNSREDVRGQAGGERVVHGDEVKASVH